ncbi:uncharacterized protein LOC128389589 isoform X2 [Panonychus citri]|uniref:uncharacterized protein LOC128389589 isoform X2 n=1 Tax=Panonychus citri TaxID=50023 RepID=UPI002307ECFD|nr:uncharacterized protein LOC128389589 isoform X2 [Panonychus citri]XP_053205177.1 uncharacterized protein LOC128389589 isoform X2 [Panonychus citri]
MVITSFHDLDRKAKRLYKNHNPLKFEVGYNVRRLGFLGMDSVHLLGTTCGRTGVIINNIVASRRFNVFGQPSTVAVKLSGQDMEPWIGLKLTSISVKAKNSFAPTSNSMIHMNSCISFGTNGSKFNGATIFQLFTDASRLSSWCLGGQFSFRSRLKTILTLSYLSPNLNMVTRAYSHIWYTEITSSISYKFTDKLKSGLSVTMVENNSPLVGLGVKYKLNEKFCLIAKVNDLGQSAFGFAFNYGPDFSFSLSVAP